MTIGQYLREAGRFTRKVADVVDATAITWGGVSLGDPDTYLIDPFPRINTYKTGSRFQFVAHQTNTGSATLNVNNRGPKDIKRPIGSALVAGDIVASYLYEVYYDDVLGDFILASTNENIVGVSTGGGGGITIPAGLIQITGRSTPDVGYLMCDGAAVSRATYPALFLAIGTNYGAGDGATTFNVPDMRGRFPLGKATAGTGSTLGGTGGAIDHTHSVPAHHHGMGTGADLNVTSSGTHTTAIDHDHGSFTSGTDSPDHTHLTTANSPASNAAMSPTTPISPGSTIGTDFSYTIAGSSLAPTHGLTSGRSATHNHGIDVPALTANSASTGAHTHASGDIAGRIGLVTGGVDGNAAMTSGTSNPPFLVVNFQITTDDILIGGGGGGGSITVPGTGIVVQGAPGVFDTRAIIPPADGITITNPDGVAGDPTLALSDDLAALEAMSGEGIVVRTGSETYAQRYLVAPAAGITISNDSGATGNPTLALANDLAALEAMSSTGLVARTAADTFALRTLTAPASGITVSNGNGVSGNPTLALADDLAALEGMSGTGIVTRTGSNTYAQRTIVGTTDLITVTNGDGVSGNIFIDLAANFKRGWLPFGNTLSMAGFQTVTIPGDYTPWIGVGTKVFYLQSGVYNFHYVISCTHSAGTTTIVFANSSDYAPTLGPAITDAYFSNESTPAGFPHWFNWTPTLTGFSANPSGTSYRFTVNGRKVTMVVAQQVAGTSNSGAKTMTPPIAARIGGFTLWGACIWYLLDNGVAQATPGQAYLNNVAPTTVQIFKATNSAAWTASGSCHFYFTLDYEI